MTITSPTGSRFPLRDTPVRGAPALSTSRSCRPTQPAPRRTGRTVHRSRFPPARRRPRPRLSSRSGRPTPTARERARSQAPASPYVSATRRPSADVAVTIAVSDVRRRSGLADYTGQLRTQLAIRITDRLNGSTGEPATVQDAPFSIDLGCAATPTTTIGSSCNLATTFDAVLPGAVTESRRAIWEVGSVRIYDGGADGIASTAADNTLFLSQGVFVP